LPHSLRALPFVQQLVKLPLLRIALPAVLQGLRPQLPARLKVAVDSQ
jgi:hypothetical protein